jgi:hypothetical protein
MGGPLSSRNTAREQQQREPGKDVTGTATQGDARRQQAVEDLGASLVLDEQRTDDVQHRADHQQPREEQAHAPALDSKIVRQRLASLRPHYQVPTLARPRRDQART